MKQVRYLCVLTTILFIICGLSAIRVLGQQNVIINLAAIDGVSITPDNVFDYQMQSFGAGKVLVKGTIRYRNSSMSLSYSFPYTLMSGINAINPNDIHPQWQFSSSAMRDLFFTYKVLPEGTFEYCVTIVPANVVKENNTNTFEECLYHRSNDIFLINLIDPENNAKLKEYNPMLSWIANYSFSNELTYRIRVAEIKQGQNPVSAVMQNQPVYDESNLVQNSVVYPVYAKPLEANIYYAWTVDAFYRGLLLGGSETWRFIIPDSIPPEYKTSRSYIDVKKETGSNQLFAQGTLKLKYVLDDSKNDILSLELTNDQGKNVSLIPGVLTARYGDNRYILNLKDSSNVKNKSYYLLKIKTKTNHEYKLPFQYVDPELIH